MCGIVTIEQYRQTAKDNGNKIIEYVKASDPSQQAITVIDYAKDYSNIYSEDGRDYKLFWFEDNQAELARAAMKERGFVPVDSRDREVVGSTK